MHCISQVHGWVKTCLVSSLHFCYCTDALHRALSHALPGVVISPGPTLHGNIFGTSPNAWVLLAALHLFKESSVESRIHANSALKQPIQSAGMSATFTQPLSWSAFKSLPYYRCEGHDLTLLKDAVENMIHDSFKFVRRLIQKYPEIFFGKQLVKLSTLTNPLTNPLKTWNRLSIRQSNPDDGDLGVVEKV